jgi:hypothetical protein
MRHQLPSPRLEMQGVWITRHQREAFFN